MTHGDHPQLSQDQKLLIRQALGLRHAAIHAEKNRTSSRQERDRLSELMQQIQDTVADIEGL